MSDYQVLIGDCIASMQTLPAQSVHTCVTSPPYFGLRSYDENGVRIDPNLSDEKRDWLIAELLRRGINARN